MPPPVPVLPRPLEDESFRSRFAAEVRRRPQALLGAILVTVLGVGLIVDGGAFATEPEPAAPDSAHGPAPSDSPVALAPGDVESWTSGARLAASTCPGLPHQVLVAIGHVETRLGEGNRPSSAGALGPMQFLPTTWAAYGTDGNGDGAVDVTDPLDALHGAARLLCANGGADPDQLRSALWNYNHSPHYVELVVRTAGLA